MKTLHAKSKIEITSKEDGFKFIASSGAVDRHGEVINQDGWDLKNYLTNPVILWGHDYYKMPIGKATKIYVEDGKLIVEGVWASEKANPDAELIRNLYLEGMVNAVSVGFIAKEWDGNTITKAELLEISLVTVPANQEALSLLKSKGFSDENIVKGFAVEIKEEGDDSEVEITEDEDDTVEIEDDATIENEKVDNQVDNEKKEEKIIEDEDEEEITPAVEEVIAPVVEDEDDDTVEITDDEELLDSEDEIVDNENKDIKAGRTLSDATRKTMQESIDAMKLSINALEKLINESDAPKGIDESFINSTEEGKILIDEKQLESVLDELRGNDTRNELAIKAVKNLLKK